MNALSAVLRSITSHFSFRATQFNNDAVDGFHRLSLPSQLLKPADERTAPAIRNLSLESRPPVMGHDYCEGTIREPLFRALHPSMDTVVREVIQDAL